MPKVVHATRTVHVYALENPEHALVDLTVHVELMDNANALLDVHVIKTETVLVQVM